MPPFAGGSAEIARNLAFHVVHLALLACLFLCSCSPAGREVEPPHREVPGAQTPASGTAPATPVPAADHRKVLVAFGDSLTAGHGVAPGLSYPDFLQKLITADGLPWRVVNEGVSGDTTTDAIARINPVLELSPKIVIVEFGGNDGLRGLPLTTTRGNMDQIVQKCVRNGSRVVLAGMTLPPNYGPDYIHEFETMYRDLAQRMNLPLIPFLLADVATSPQLMQPDGIHPTAEGNQKVAAAVYRVLRPLLK